MATTTSARPSNPTTPAFTNDKDWINAYLDIHVLSVSSYRYSYLLWFGIAFIFLVFSALHLTGSRGGFIGALWSKWSIRRRTFRKKRALAIARRNGQPHRQPEALPSNAQLLCLCILSLATVALSFAGPDYIAPGDKAWQFYRRGWTPLGMATSTAYSPPQYTISKAWWTAGGRTGELAFALLPLCILFALKAPPFAIFAIPFMVQLHFDKLAWLHRWCGRLIWIMSAAHVVLWSVQLVNDRREETGRMAYVYAWLELKFIWGWIAFTVLTLIMAFSIYPLRRAYYEVFYFLHILLVPLFLVAAGFHHPPVWWWCGAALALWIGERLWRGTWWLFNNGYFGGMSRSRVALGKEDKELEWGTNIPLGSNVGGQSFDSSTAPHHQQPEDHRLSYLSQSHSHTGFIRDSPSPPTSTNLPLPSDAYVPPPGYAHAELLAGRTVRLRFITPGFLTWAPGQHVLVNVPSVSKFTSHPFTIASVCDEHGPDGRRMMVLLIRAKDGWTKDLWDAVVKLTISGQAHPPGEHPGKGTDIPARGVLMRTYVDGPFGSSSRARWGTHSSVLVIAGGTGVSFGLAVLEYVCMCLSGRDGRELGGRPGGWGTKSFKTTRVRFVWLVREFSHIQWGATILRRCLAMVPAPDLQIEIFVTNFKPLPTTLHDTGGTVTSTAPIPQLILPHGEGQDDLMPPQPIYARHGGHSQHDSSESLDHVDAAVKTNFDLSYDTGVHRENDHRNETRDWTAMELYTDHETHILDLTNFDGDVDAALPGEDIINRNVKKQGKLRRAITRKATLEAATDAKAKPQEGLADAIHLRLPGIREQSRGRPRGRDSYPPSRDDISLPLSRDSRYSRSPSRDGRHSHTHTPSGDNYLPTDKLLSNASQVLAGLSNQDLRPDTASTYEPPILKNATGEEVRLEIEAHEMRDLNVVSEHARPGKPKLDEIVAEEVEKSAGSVVVACCGPESLCAMMRKIIAAKIDPARLRQGDKRGSITLVSEEFKY